MKLYVAGPMTGLQDHNFPAFNHAAEQLRNTGYAVVNPADNGAEPGQSWLHYMRLDLAQMLTCDGVATLPGWQSSRGASLEVHVAHRLGLPVRGWFGWCSIVPGAVLSA